MMNLRFACRSHTNSRLYSVAASASKPALSKSDSGSIKTIDDLPGPPRLPGYGSLWLLRNMMDRRRREKMLVHMEELVNKYGKMVNISVAGEKVLALACPKVMEEVFRTQEKGLPIRRAPIPWVEYIAESGQSAGLLTSQKEEWKKRRWPVSPLLLKPRSFDSYAPAIQRIVREFSESLHTLADNSGFVDKLPDRLAHLAQEGS